MSTGIFPGQVPTAIGSLISGGGSNEILYVNASGVLSQGGFFDGTNFKVPGYIEGQGYAASYYNNPIIPFDFSHMSLALYDGQNNGFLGIYSQVPGNYWNFLQTDASGNWVSRMTMGDPGDGTITFSSAKWENSAFIIGGFGGGFGGSYCRVTSPGGQGFEIGDGLGAIFNTANNGFQFNCSNTLQVNNFGNSGSSQFIIYDSAPQACFSVTGDTVLTFLNSLDDGLGNSIFIGTCTAASHITSGGSSSQFVKGDGSLDGASYGTGTVTSVGGTSPISSSGGTTPVISISSVPIIKSSASLAAQSSGVSITTYTPGSTGSFMISGYLNVTAVTLDVIKLTITFKDENGVSQTVTPLTGIGAIGNNYFNAGELRCNNSIITVSTTLTTGTGTIAYDVGSTIIQLR